MLTSTKVSIGSIGILQLSEKRDKQMSECLDFFEPVLFSQNDRSLSKAIFLNNRTLVSIVTSRMNQTLQDRLTEELIKVYKEYDNLNYLPEFEIRDLKENYVYISLLHSAAILSCDRFAFHKLASLPKIVEDIDSMSKEELKEVTRDGLALTPIINIADLMLQHSEAEIRQFGLQYLNIANKMAKKLSHNGALSRIYSLYGAYYLDQGNLSAAEKILTDPSEVPNYFDYTKYLNLILLGLHYRRAGDMPSYNSLSSKAENLRSVLSISDIAEDVAWLIFPPGLVIDGTN